MLKIRIVFLLIFYSSIFANGQTQEIFSDDFSSLVMDQQKWHIPTWVSSSDGTYMGRTQMRVTQNASLPALVNGEASIDLETYNPTGFSFYGTDLITKRSFSRGNGLVFTIRAKLSTPAPGGIVGGIFLYELKDIALNHDELDYELLTNRPGEIQTNIYNNEPLGAGNPEFKTITGTITDYHTYVIKWLPGETIWMIDGAPVRSLSSGIPEGPMHFHLNMWAPAAEWAAAYDANLQPVNSPGLNQKTSMIVDYVKVDSILNPITQIRSPADRGEMSFYPNPAGEVIYFNSPSEIHVSVYSITGALVLNRKDVQNGSMSLSGISPGLYILKLENNGRFTEKKLLIR